MVILNARPVLVIAAIVWLLWRALLWHRRSSPDAARECRGDLRLVARHRRGHALPTYDHPLRLAPRLEPHPARKHHPADRRDPAEFAFENIAGNLILFAPRHSPPPPVRPSRTSNRTAVASGSNLAAHHRGHHGSDDGVHRCGPNPPRWAQRRRRGGARRHAGRRRRGEERHRGPRLHRCRRRHAGWVRAEIPSRAIRFGIWIVLAGIVAAR